MQKKYQVFVSSTFRDLQEERQDAIRNILDLGHIPAGMELFPAADTEQLVYIKKVIDECDYYVLIMGGRYGSLDNEGVSYTEREYDYAVATGKTVLAFPHGDLLSIPAGKVDMGERLRQNLAAFKDKVMTGRLVREWTSREQLEGLVLKALIRATTEYPAVGWIRGNAAAKEDVLDQINTLRIENDNLLKQVRKLTIDNKPKYDDLAGLDDLVTIHFQITVHKPRMTPYEKSEERETTWAKIFSYVGPRLSSPTTRVSIKHGLKSLLTELLGVSSSPTIREADLYMVESHLVALNLVKSYNANSINGGLNHFLSLSEHGKAKLVEITAVRKNGN